MLKLGTAGDLSALAPDRFGTTEVTLRFVEELSIRLLLEKRSELFLLQAEDLSTEAQNFVSAVIGGVFGDGS